MSSIANHNSIDSDEEEEFIRGMELSLAYVFTPVLVASIDLNLFGIIAKKCSVRSSEIACVSSSEIASHLGTQNPNAPSVLDQMLRLLATHSLLTSCCRALEDGRAEILYGITPLSKMFIQNEDGVSLARFAGLVRYIADHVTRMCSEMKEAVFKVHPKTESPCPKELSFDFGTNEVFDRDFDKGMSEISTMVMKSILKHSKAFDGLNSLVDVGGGDGTCLNMIISKHPSISGIIFDLPRISKQPSIPGIERVGGDMLKEIPKGDVILLKSVLHNWSDEKCLVILKNCYAALPQSGKVIGIELVLSETPGTSPLNKYASLIDNLMLCELGAKERTTSEFKALAKGAGFSKFMVQYGGCGHSVMELYK